ncbi:MAG: hypothetical protein HZB26_22625 [Candidatus Hydrogenedentes bacterium]|nr:hypothetical protein [Candidatus Hydrogenedentota bacterium]
MRCLYSSLVLAVVFAAGNAFAEAAPEVKGALKVNGAEIPIKFVCLLQHDNEEGMLDGPELRMLLADREVDSGLLKGIALDQLDTMAREGKVRGLILRVDPKKEPREVHGTLLIAPASAQASLPFFTQSGSETSIKKLEIKDGKASVELDYASTGDSAFEDMPKFEYKLAFTAPIRPNDKITARLTGAEAVKSPQAKVAMDFEKAVRSGDLDAARKLDLGKRMLMIDQAVKEMGKEKFLEQARQFIADPATREKQLSLVVVRGKGAIVVFKEEHSRTTVPLVEVDGVWKIE